jgi:peptide/nickel transport system ATP-binding protein
MVFQDPASSLDPRMSVGESIGEPLVRRHPRKARTARVAELLALVDIDPARAGQLPGAFSGGQKQRIAMARALAAEPSVVIADEITSALDVSVQGSMLNVVRQVQRKLGFSMLFISHNLAVVRYISDAIAVMYHGRIIETAPTDDLVQTPQHDYTKSLLAAVPRMGRREGAGV